MGKINISIFLAVFFTASSVFAQVPPSAQGDKIEQLVERGINYEQAGNLNDAIETYRQVLALDSRNTLAQIRLAKLLSWQLKLDEALYILDSLLENYPGISEAVFRKAQILSWQKKYSDSIKLYLQYLELEKDDADGLSGLARAYFWSGDYENAAATFNMALEAGYYNETEVRLNLAKIYLNQNNPDDAKKEIELVLENDPGNSEAKELYASLPLFMKHEASLALRGEVFPDSFGFKASPGFVYRPGRSWEFTGQYDFYALEGKNDSTISAGAVYKGIKQLSLGTSLSITPSPDYSEAAGIAGFASYSINRKIGAGLMAETLFYTANANPVLEDDTLYTIKPSFSYFFTDISNATLQYISYIYASGFTTSAVSLSVVIEYYRDNPLSFALTYGGDYETQNNSRTIFEAGGGISYRFTNNLEISMSFNHIEAEYSKVNQFTIAPVYSW